MPKPETLHGDEEVIERASAAFYEALEPYSSPKTGEVDGDAARDVVATTYAELMIGADGRAITDLEYLAAIDSGHDDAVQTHLDKQEILDWI